MAGFGGGKAKKPKETPPKLTSGESVARTAQREYNQLKRDGGTVALVYARLKGAEEWYSVGCVSGREFVRGLRRHVSKPRP